MGKKKKAHPVLMVWLGQTQSHDTQPWLMFAWAKHIKRLKLGYILEGLWVLWELMLIMTCNQNISSIKTWFYQVYI